MNRISICSKVGRDGFLELSVPVGLENANQEVRVTVEPIVASHLTPAQWKAQILETGGKWQGDFERPTQGDYEQRESLS
jgi:hypothetical protein